jgi:hypothetical protein
MFSPSKSYVLFVIMSISLDLLYIVNRVFTYYSCMYLFFLVLAGFELFVNCGLLEKQTLYCQFFFYFFYLFFDHDPKVGSFGATPWGSGFWGVTGWYQSGFRVISTLVTCG